MSSNAPVPALAPPTTRDAQPDINWQDKAIIAKQARAAATAQRRGKPTSFRAAVGRTHP